MTNNEKYRKALDLGVELREMEEEAEDMNVHKRRAKLSQSRYGYSYPKLATPGQPITGTTDGKAGVSGGKTEAIT